MSFPGQPRPFPGVCADHFGFHKMKGRGRGKAHPAVLPAHTPGASWCLAECSLTFSSRCSCCYCSSFCHLLRARILALVLTAHSSSLGCSSCLPTQAPAQEPQADPTPFFHLTAAQVFQLPTPSAQCATPPLRAPFPPEDDCAFRSAPFCLAGSSSRLHRRWGCGQSAWHCARPHRRSRPLLACAPHLSTHPRD